MTKTTERLWTVAKHPVTQGAVELGTPLLKTTILDHRFRTHDSVIPGRWTRLALEVMGAPFTDTSRWAMLHLDHHSCTDADLRPAIELHDLIEWLQGHPEEFARHPLPETVYGIDPGVPEMALDDAVAVGALARQLVEGKYLPQQHYTTEEVERILRGRQPRYLYEEPSGNKAAVKAVGSEPSLYDIRFMLRDPHSPVLHPDGVRGILFHNLQLYDDAVTFYNRNEELVPEFLRRTPTEEFIEKHKKAIRLGATALSAATRVALDQPKSPQEAAKSALLGAGIFATASGILIAGSAIVNAGGHAGDMNIGLKQLGYNFLDGTVAMKPDGTYSMKLKGSWAVKQFASAVSLGTLDEVNGQEIHHINPWRVAYTDKTGFEGFREAPFGTVVDQMARRGILFTLGPGYPDRERRPDMPSEALEYLTVLRQREYARSHSS